MAHIYRILNVVTDQFYVGSATKFKRRKWEHLDSLKKNTHHCEKLQAAWNMYGADAFEFEVLEEVEDAIVLQVDDMYLAQFAGQDVCYNTALSTAQPPSIVSETREKIRQTMLRIYADKTNHPRFGKTHSAETRAKISAAKLANPARPWLGKERSDETKQKISETQKGKSKGPRVYTPEGLEKARENMRRHAKKSVPLSFDDVKAKFPAAVLEKYDFGNAVYTGALNRIEGCVCPEHGVFSQYAAQFRKGRGCPMCGGVQRAQSKSKQMKAEWAVKKRLDTPQNKAYIDCTPGKSGAFDSPG